MAKQLGIAQDSVSRLEKRSDLLLSTLRKTVEAMGGELSLVAEFPDRPPVVLSVSPKTRCAARRRGRTSGRFPMTVGESDDRQGSSERLCFEVHVSC